MNSDDNRIAQKAHELWEAEGRPHGRDQFHWDEAKEIIALHESAGVALLPRDAGAEEPVEERSVAIDNEGQAPSLTDTGEHDLTSIDREPTFAQPDAAKPKAKSAAKKTAPADATKRSSPATKKAGKKVPR